MFPFPNFNSKVTTKIHVSSCNISNENRYGNCFVILMEQKSIHKFNVNVSFSYNLKRCVNDLNNYNWRWLFFFFFHCECSIFSIRFQHRIEMFFVFFFVLIHFHQCIWYEINIEYFVNSTSCSFFLACEHAAMQCIWSNMIGTISIGQRQWWTGHQFVQFVMEPHFKWCLYALWSGWLHQSERVYL